MPSGTNTFLGSLEYKLEHLPSFYVAEIETRNADSMLCLSNRLRIRAVQEFLRSIEITYPYAINHKAKMNQLHGNPNVAEKGPVNHLIVLCDNKGNVSSGIKAALTSGYNKELNRLTQKRRTAEGILDELSITCRVISTPRTVEPPTPENESDKALYFRCLDTFISTMINGTEGNDQVTNPATKVWYPKPMPLIVPHHRPRTVDLGETALKRIAKHCSVSIRAEPVLNLENKTFRLDYDLALRVVDKSRVHEILFETYGHGLLGSQYVDQLPAIKGTLIGLEVTLDYTHESLSKPASNYCGSVRSLKSKGSTIGLYNGSKNSKCVHPTQAPSGRFRIQDIRMPGDVPRIEISTGSNMRDDEAESKYCVADYFEFVKKIELWYPQLPLAEVRRDTWIPLEFLKVAEPQLLHNTKHLSHFMGIHADEYVKDRVHAEQELRQVGKQYLTQVINRIKGTPAESKCIFRDLKAECVLRSTFHSQMLIARQGRRVQENPNERQIDRTPPPNGPLLTANVVYFPSPNSSTSQNEEFVSFVTEGLKNSCNINGLTVSSAHHIVSVDKLLSLDKHLAEMKLSSEDVLIGIVDKTARTSAVVDHIRAEFYRFAHITLGALAVVVSKQDLDKYYRTISLSKGQLYEPGSYNTQFPNGVLQKINYMLGGMNYAPPHTQKPSDFTKPGARKDNNKKDGKTTGPRPSNTMIMGAHVSHPGSLAGPSCPSVASLVATDKNWTHYFASARVQPTMKDTQFRSDKGAQRPGIKHVVQLKIVDLKNMVIERLRARTRPKEQTAMVFFRTGIDPSSPDVQAEISEIEAAHKSVYGNDVEVNLAYIVVNRNSKNADTMGESHFVTDDSSDVPKYLYTICRKYPDITEDGLSNLVSP